MKKTLLIIFLLAFTLCGTVMAQSQAFKYQAVARTANGGLLINKPITIRLTIKSGTATGTTEYQETQSVTTDAYGLFTLEVGSGTATVGTFAAVNWASAQKYIQTEADLGSGYVLLGASKLLSVPYAIYAFNPGPQGAVGPVGPIGPVGPTGPTGAGLVAGNAANQIYVTGAGGALPSAPVSVSGDASLNNGVLTITGISSPVSGANLTNLPASKISGVVPVANLGTGTATANTFLNGTGAFSTPITLTTTGTGAATLSGNALNVPTPGAAAFSSLTTTGASGASTLTGGVLNVPAYTLTGLGGITATSTDVLTNKNLTSATNTFPTLNQSTTGNAATATKLAATKTINGVAFDGSTNITVPADATTLTGTSLPSTIVGSSLTSVGTLSGLIVTAPIAGSITGNAATVTTNANLTGDVTSVGNTTTIGTGKVVTANIADNAVTVAKLAATGTLPAFNGAALTNLNASNIASGKLALAQLPNSTLPGQILITDVTNSPTYQSIVGDITLNPLNGNTTYTNVVPATKGGAGTVTGVLKANGSGSVSAAVSGTDYQAPITLTTTGTGAATFSGNTLNVPTPGAAAFSSLTTTGSSGASTLSGGVLNVPTYTLTGLGGITASSTDVLTHKDLTSITNTFPTLNQNTSGNAATATKLAATKTINGVAFDGSANITVPADANTLSGTALPALDGAALTNLNASNIASGKLALAQLPNSALPGQILITDATKTPTYQSIVGDITLNPLNGNTIYNGIVPSNFGGAGTVTGILKADGAGNVSAATVGTDYLSPASTLSSAKLSGALPALDGSVLTNLSAANITGTNTLPAGVLPATVTTLGNTVNTGNGLVQLASGVLPAVDGSLLTNLPAGPAGPAGPNGPPGPAGSISAGGTYSPATTYMQNQVVFYNGSSYVSLTSSNVNHTPPSSTTFWAPLALGGAAGAQGPAGAGFANGSAAGQIYLTGSSPFSPQNPQSVTGDINISSTAVTSYNNIVPTNKGGAGNVNGILSADGSGTVSAASSTGSGSVVLASGTTGSGNAVLATSPTLVTPNLGTPSALVGTNISGTAANLFAGAVSNNATAGASVVSAINTVTGTGSVINAARLGTGPTNTTFLRGDGTFAAPPSGGGGGTLTFTAITSSQTLPQSSGCYVITSAATVTLPSTTGLAVGTCIKITSRLGSSAKIVYPTFYDAINVENQAASPGTGAGMDNTIYFGGSATFVWDGTIWIGNISF